MSRSRAFCHCEWHPRTVQDAVSRCAAAAFCAKIFQSRHTLAPLLKVYTSPARCGFSSGNVKSSILRPFAVPKAHPPALGSGVELFLRNSRGESSFVMFCACVPRPNRGSVGGCSGMSSEGFPHGAEELYASSVVQGLHGVHWPAFLVAVVLGPQPSLLLPTPWSCVFRTPACAFVLTGARTVHRGLDQVRDRLGAKGHSLQHGR